MTINTFIADDHSVLLDGLEFILEADASITVVGKALNGREALRKIQQLKPDIAILDIAMPELNGIETTAKITETVPKTRVLILSMYSTKEHIYRALKSGAQGYILKESAGKEIVQAVHHIYAGHRYLSDKISEILIDDYVEQRKNDSFRSPIELLSDREKEILQLVAEGKSSAKIAEMIYLSPKTVETYRSRMMQKIGVKDLSGLIKFAIQHGLISVE